MAQPIRFFFWRPSTKARDRHLVPGSTTPDLRPSLFVRLVGDIDHNVQTFVSPPINGGTLSFEPLFNATLSGNTYTSVGLSQQISVDKVTGAVSVGTAAPVPGAPIRSSFIIEVTLKVPGRDEPYRQAIRMHVHRAVQQAWLTPSRLFVPAGTTPNASETLRFTVRAQFTDNIVGDVTVDHGVTWSPPSRVSADGGLRVIAGDNPGDEIPIVATLPAILGGHATPPAKMHVAAPWTVTVPRAELVAGGGVPSAAAPPERSPNVLFLSDGFTAAHQTRYAEFVDTIVDRMRRSKFMRPYDLLAGSINFWRVFVPSEVAGVSCRDEFYTRLVDGEEVATALPAGLRPPETGPWTLRHLIYAVGYPITSNGDAGSTAAPLAVLRSNWVQSLNAPWSARVGDTNVVSDTVITEWQALATRTVIDDIDGGFPGVAMGEPPAAQGRAEALLRLHAERGGEDMLDDFLVALRADDGTTLADGRDIGHLWRRPANPAFAFDNTELIVLLNSFPGGRPNNSHRSIALGTDPQYDFVKVTPIAGRNSFRLAPNVPERFTSEVPFVVAHELGHSFGLGDEYQNFDERHPQLVDTDLDKFGNLQFESLVRTGPNGPLQTARIKWNWPRIRKATVVTGPITAEAGGTQFRVPVIDSLLFDPGDIVLLRLRKPHEPLGMRTPPVALTFAQEAEVVGPVAGGSLLLKPASGSALAFATLLPFVPGSVLFSPTPAPASVKSSAYPYAEMIAKNVRDYIDANDKPLSPLPCTLSREGIVAAILPGVKLRTEFCRVFTPRIVGLFAGGERFSCGVFHPTGSCIMAPGDEVERTTFCPVCRYILVDFINPAAHSAIDDDYDDVYPQPL